MRRIIALSLLALFAVESTGCYAWHQDSSPVPKLDRGKPTDRYRITLTTGRVVQLTNLHVQHDSLVGVAVGRLVRGSLTPVLMGFPVTQVTRVERQSFGSVATVFTVAALGFLIQFVVCQSHPNCRGGFSGGPLSPSTSAAATERAHRAAASKLARQVGPHFSGDLGCGAWAATRTTRIASQC
jgi:hypothetical protein